MDETTAAIDYAAKFDIPLSPEDFTVIDGGVYLDGMDPIEWVDAMVME